MFDSFVVLNGPFKGMMYPSRESVGSMIYPKLIGSYESELHPILYDLLKINYSEVIDVGCAEGYYAIGFTLNFKNTKVFAYHTNEKARNLCRRMAKINGVEDNLIIESTLTNVGLNLFKFSGRGLIICDCGGFELELFSNQNISNLKNCDLIIELHDFIDIEISKRMKERFSNSHNMQSIYSIDDIHKAYEYGLL